MLTFSPHGPFPVPMLSGPGGRTITATEGAKFWSDHPSLAKERGCYIFAMRSGGGVRPTYVGKATKTFEQETFTHHKLSEHYHRALVSQTKGTPVLFFFFHPRKKGATNRKLIDALETFLIQQCKWRNPNRLTNKRKLPKHKWAVSGVVRSGVGKPSHSALSVRSLIGVPGN
jgi:hypothetical protein